MLDQIEDLKRRIEAETLDSEEAVEAYRIRYLGQRNGLVTLLARQMSQVPRAERPAVGQALNALKRLAEQRLEDARNRLRQHRQTRPVDLDLTLPGRRAFVGSVHPLTQTLEDITRFFERYGFSVETGPEIEDDWHNFTALNFPPDHPARDMQDTFFLEEPAEGKGGVVLRTHTSPVQIRVMEERKPPLRIIAPGRVYRNEAISFKSFCLFHQVEGLYVDEGVSMADLKQILHAFARALFGDDVQMRFRPSFFPFTEPSAEVDIWWPDANRPDGGRWMEILGCGMVDPNVLEACGIDAERYTGYAFGMGVERITMLRYDIDDIRIFYENDLRFLQQF
ncbi:phenylalanine--tRNA ligase subunit alpha [Rhodothermaceae bacterium RA]|nr:phenylalanine--tRNA ligase subunit alpha [Rhodothermaceae bacterium RA]